MFVPNNTLQTIVTQADDNNCVVEFYADGAAPPFDANDALLRLTNVENLSAFGLVYQKLVLSFGKATRTGKKEKNSFSVTIDNLNRDAADFELSGAGFEGLIMVVRLVSRTLSIDPEDSLVFFVGRCMKPKEGSKSQMAIEAEQIFGSVTPVIPRRKYTPEDPKGRLASDPNFEGFIYTPSFGTVTWPRRKSSWFGLIKKKFFERMPWSSVSNIDAKKSLPEAFGRVQLLATHLAYADVGSIIKTSSAFCEGKIKEYLRIFSTDYRYSTAGIFHQRYGYPPNLGPTPYEQIPIPESGWPANGYFANTAWVGAQWTGTAIDQTDPAPDVAALLLAKILKLPDDSGEFNIDDWSDNAAAIVRWALTDPNYENLAESWLNDASFFEAYKYNLEFLFDKSFSDLIFAPTGSIASGNVESSGLLMPTGTVTSEYLKFLGGDAPTAAFSKSVNVSEYDSLIPIEPPIDPPDPDDPPDTPFINLNVFLRRRYTFNGLTNDEQKLWDWLNEAVLTSARMYLTQGFDGRVSLKHKKPADFALALEDYAAGDTEIALDDVAPWVADLRGSVLVQPYSSVSEVRAVSSAAYDIAQNDVTFTASSNMTVEDFAGCDGLHAPAAAVLTVDSVLVDGVDADPNSIVLDGVEIAVIASSADTVETLAGFFYGSINAHPQLRRKFTATWEPGTDEVTVTGKFGTLALSGALGANHPGPVDNPVDAPALSVGAGSLPAGDYLVGYAYENANGRTLISPLESVTIADDKKIVVEAITLPAGIDSAIWYASPGAGSSKLRYLRTDDGAGFEIDALPRLNDGLPNDFNRTGTEVLRVEYVFSDRGLIRANTVSANVLKDSYKFILGRREESVNVVTIEFYDSTQDFRLVQLKLRDETHIAKVKKENKLEVDGSGIDSFNQAYRIAAAILAEQRDADFFYQNESDREALFLEEGDVVCVTDAGAGVVNLACRVEDISYDDLAEGLPKAQFVMRKYTSTLYDDSVVEREIPVFQTLDVSPDALRPQTQFEDDIEFLAPDYGIILVDRTTATRYRLLVDGGVLDIEEVV